MRSLFISVFCISCIFAPAVQATRFVALTTDNEIVWIEGDAPKVVERVHIPKLEGTLLGLDIRPSTGRLYVLSSAGEIVQIDPETQKILRIQKTHEQIPSNLTVVDFDPLQDVLRLMGPQYHATLNVDTRHITEQQTPPQNTESTISGGAHTGSRRGLRPITTSFYTLDAGQRSLNLQYPISTGEQVKKADFPNAAVPGVSFDISTSLQDIEVGYLLSEHKLYEVEIPSGLTKLLGTIDTVNGITFKDITVLQE